MLQEEQELMQLLARIERLSGAVDEADQEDPNQAISELQQRVPGMSRTEELLPMYDTPEEAIEASRDPSRNRLKSLEDNSAKYIERGE